VGNHQLHQTVLILGKGAGETAIIKFGCFFGLAGCKVSIGQFYTIGKGIGKLKFVFQLFDVATRVYYRAYIDIWSAERRFDSISL